MREDREAAALRRLFARYYSSRPVPPPPRFPRREFAFTLFGGQGMVRHLAFGSASELSSFLAERVPRNAYYSTAYYERPAAPEMGNKGWMGADLVFDLDADHMGRSGSWEELLMEVRRETVRLVHEFLLGELGIPKDSLRVVFSGGRGFHVHVHEREYLRLGPDERREIVLYVKGKELDPKRILRGRLPSPGETGWRGRLARALLRLLEGEKPEGVNGRRWRALRRWLEGEAEAVLPDGSRIRGKRGEVLRELVMRAGSPEMLRGREYVLQMAAEMAASEYGILAADEPVTTDIHRLIRLPYSLHGKSGFQVRPVPLGELEEFDPLSDAIVDVFRRGEFEIVGLRRFSIRLGEEEWGVEEGERLKVPAYVFVFMCGYGAARLA